MPNQKGKSFSPKDTTPEYIPQGVSLASVDNGTDFLFNSKSDKKLIEAKKNIKKKKEDKEHLSEEFKMLSDPYDNRGLKSDKDIDEVTQTTQDLAIDG